MFRILRILFLVLLAYAILTATSAQREDMLRGALAVKDAIVQSCQREGGLCTMAVEKVRSIIFSNSSSTATDKAAPQ